MSEFGKTTETTTPPAPVSHATPLQQPVPSGQPSSAPAPNHWLLAEKLTYIFVGVLEMVLAFRFVLSLLAANRDNPFADLVFGVSTPFVAPFLNLFNFQTAYGASRFELETLFAMAVYALLGVLIVSLLRLPRHITRT